MYIYGGNGWSLFEPSGKQYRNDAIITNTNFIVCSFVRVPPRSLFSPFFPRPPSEAISLILIKTMKRWRDGRMQRRMQRGVHRIWSSNCPIKIARGSSMRPFNATSPCFLFHDPIARVLSTPPPFNSSDQIYSTLRDRSSALDSRGWKDRGGCITTGFLSLFDESWSQRAPACKLSSHLIKSRPSVKRCFFEGRDPLTRRVSAIIAVYLYDSITNFLFSTVAFPLLSSLLQHFDFWKILKSRLKFERS